jgi:glycosyltransferase involved in cell wall biosynthesis
MSGSRRDPRRIDQIIPSVVEHDAVSNHTFEAQRLLRTMGFESEIYCKIIGPGCDDKVHSLAALPVHDDGSQWLLYQCSIGSPAGEVFAAHPAPKLLDYHNITPAALVARWIPPLGEESRLGRRQLAAYAPLVHAAFADSGFNAAELAAAGYRNPSVVPVMRPGAHHEAEPDEAVLARLSQAKREGGADWLFVGQVAPHKAQHDIVKAFACYRRAYDPRARLHLVGREMGDGYRNALRAFAASIGLADAVDIAGSVSSGALTAYYRSADVFVCCSDHEGFCVPIIEAMHRGVPVVAYAAAAVPETVGRSGVLLESKDPNLVAAAVHHLLGDDVRRAQAVAAGREQAERYTVDGARSAFRRTITEALARV